MSLRRKLIAYLILIHIVFGTTTWHVFAGNHIWIFALEAFFIVSLGAGIYLLRAMLKPLDIITTGSELIEEGDFTSTFREAGQPETDRLIALFNGMIERLRDERLQTEEQHYFMHRLIEATPTGILILDYDGGIEIMNESAGHFFETAHNGFIGKRLAEVQTPLAEALDRLDNEQTAVVPFHGNRRLKCTASRFFDRGFERRFILIEELTDEIRRSEKTAYEKLIRLLSHEVNNSVGAVNSLIRSCLNYSGQLADEDREDFSNALAVSSTRLDHLNEFMRGYADIVRLPEPDRTEGDIMLLLRDCEDLFHGECLRRNISWEWKTVERLPPFSFDRGQMEQVFVNIIKNALESIGDDGTITIETVLYKGKYTVVIEDTGHGITDEIRKNLFTPFFSTKDNGQGIGLTLVSEILKRHNYDFSLEGDPGGPTRFTIWFDG